MALNLLNYTHDQFVAAFRQETGKGAPTGTDIYRRVMKLGESNRDGWKLDLRLPADRVVKQIEDGGDLDVGKIARTIRHEAVGGLQDGFEQGALVVDGAGECGTEERGGVPGAFDASAEIEKPPALSSGHAFVDEPGEGEQFGEELIEQFEYVGWIEAVEGGAFAGLGDAVNGAPGVDGDSIAHG